MTEKQRGRERKTCRQRATDWIRTQAHSIWLPAHSNELNRHLTLLFVKLPSNPVYNPIKHLQNAPQQVHSMDPHGSASNIPVRDTVGQFQRIPEIPCVHPVYNQSELVFNMRGIYNTEHAVLVKEEKLKKRLDSWSHNIFNFRYYWLF